MKKAIFGSILTAFIVLMAAVSSCGVVTAETATEVVEEVVLPRGTMFDEFPGLGKPGDGFPFFASLKQTMIYYIGLWIILPFYSVYDLLIGHTLRAAGTIKAIITGILGFMIGSMIGSIVGIIIGAAIFIIPIPIIPIMLNLILAIIFVPLSWFGTAMFLAALGFAGPMVITMERDYKIAYMFGTAGRIIATLIVTLPLLILKIPLPILC